MTRTPPPASWWRGRRWLRVALWVAVGGAAAWLWFDRTARIRLSPPAASTQAVDLALIDLQGRALDLRDLRGKVVLLNLWAGWCGPCRAEIPRLNRLAADYGPAGLVVIGLNVEALRPDDLSRLAERFGIAYTVARPVGPLRGPLRPAGPIPQTWWIDRAGRVRASRVGLVPERGLQRACETLLQEDGT